jgi:8-oxo-dGTP diphosphatase
MERVRAIGIIIKEGKILLLKRFVKGKGAYYVFPGGDVEDGETPEQAAIREIKEGASLDIGIEGLLWDFKDMWHHGLYFLAKDPKGEIRLGDGPEKQEQSADDSHEPVWVPLEDIQSLLLYPEKIKNRIIEKFLRK